MPDYHPELQSFHIPLAEDSITLREALDRLESIGNAPGDVPLMVKIMENPSYDVPPLSIFKGRVTLEQHDCAHILLGRGTTLIDEAFTIGFTMGSSNQMTSQATKVFAYVAANLYPKPYRFHPQAERVFHDAVHLGMISDCTAFEDIDFAPLMHLPLREVREQIHLETELLHAYFTVEARRNPKIPACKRLI